MSTLISFRMYNNILTKSFPVLLLFHSSRYQPLLSKLPRLLTSSSLIPTFQFHSASPPYENRRGKVEGGTLLLKWHLTPPTSTLVFAVFVVQLPPSPKESMRKLVSISFHFNIYSFLFTGTSIYLHAVYVHHMPVAAHEYQEATNPLRPLWITGVGSGNQSWVFCNSSMHP